MKIQPLIAVRNVERSREWYQKLLELSSGHGGSDYERLFSGEEMILQLHRWGAHEHPYLGDAEEKSRGNGIVLWFVCEQIEQLLGRVKRQDVTVLMPLHINENANHREIWLQDPDGYVVVVAGAYGDLG